MKCSSFQIKNTWKEAMDQLVTQNYITIPTAQSLALYFANINQISGVENALAKLEALVKKSKISREAFIELKYLVRHLKTFNILDKVSVRILTNFFEIIYIYRFDWI